jgi:hypothetical protein
MQLELVQYSSLFLQVPLGIISLGVLRDSFPLGYLLFFMPRALNFLLNFVQVRVVIG